MSRSARRCLVVMGALGKGGAERQAVLTARALAAAGVTARLFVCQPPLDGLPEARALGVEVDAPGPVTHLGAQLGRLRAALAHLAPDAAIAFLPGSGARLALACLGSAGGRPRWIQAVRGNHAAGDGLRTPVQAVLREACLRAADRVVANSASLAANTVATAPFVAAKLEIVPNVLLPEPADPRAARRALARLLADGEGAPPGPILGAIGSVRRERNYALLARAFAVVRGRHPHARLVIAGRFDTPECRAPLAELRAALREAGVERAVTLAGHVPGARRLVPAFDAFVLCSQLEGSSNALAEALAAGAAVATTPAGDAAELVGDAGAVAPGFTTDALAGAMLEVLAHRRAYRAAAGHRGAALLEARSPGAVGARWAEVIASAVRR